MEWQTIGKSAATDGLQRSRTGSTTADLIRALEQAYSIALVTLARGEWDIGKSGLDLAAKGGRRASVAAADGARAAGNAVVDAAGAAGNAAADAAKATGGAVASGAKKAWKGVKSLF
jgi:hypothetical protein